MGCFEFFPIGRDSDWKIKKLPVEEKSDPTTSWEVKDSGSGTTSGSHVLSDSSIKVEKVDVVVEAVLAADSSGTKLFQSGSLRKPNDLKDFTLHELKCATKNFDRRYLLGEGGFGQVFRGTMKQKQKYGGGDEKIDVAVKQLNSRGQQGHKEWLAEVHFLGLVDCPHLVKLIGYCANDEDERGIQRLLVYEFMQNKGLDDHLFRQGPNSLPWTSRVKIVLGAARGLAYLHEDLDFQVIFRDFKTSNVLLDEDFNPKLSDFGLARHGPEDGDGHVSTAVVGTAGYAAPEYIQTGHLTVKSDVWSFGIVMLEVLTGRRVVDKNRPKNEQRLVEWAKPYINDKHKFFQIVDPSLNGRYPLKPAQKFAQLAYQCLRLQKYRPKMSDVVDRLTTVLERTYLWESPALQSPTQGSRVQSMKLSQELSRLSSPRSLTLGSLPSAQSGKVSHFGPRGTDAADTLVSNLSLDGSSRSSISVSTSGPEPRPVVDKSGPEPKPVVDTPGPEPKPVVDTPGPEPKPVVDTPGPEPKPVDDTPGPGPEPKPVGDTPGSEPEPVDTPAEISELLDTSKEKPKLVGKPKLVDSSGEGSSAVSDVAKGRSRASDRLFKNESRKWPVYMDFEAHLLQLSRILDSWKG